MALAIALQTNSNGQPCFEIGERSATLYVTLTASGSYTTGGDSLDFTKITFPGGISFPIQSVPHQGWVQSQPAAGGSASGYLYAYLNGAAITGCKLQVFNSGGSGNPHVELSAGAYPGGVTGDTIVGAFVFMRA